MNIEQERAAFEWWASDEGESPRATERAGGCYKLAQIQSYWVAWQARAALDSEQQPDVTLLVEALERIMTWPGGGNRYGQANIKVFAAEALAAHRKQGGGE